MPENYNHKKAGFAMKKMMNALVVRGVRFLKEEDGFLHPGNMLGLAKIIFWLFLAGILIYSVYGFFVVGFFGGEKEDPYTGTVIEMPKSER